MCMLHNGMSKRVKFFTHFCPHTPPHSLLWKTKWIKTILDTKPGFYDFCLCVRKKCRCTCFLGLTNNLVLYPVCFGPRNLKILFQYFPLCYSLGLYLGSFVAAVDWQGMYGCWRRYFQRCAP